MEFQNSLSLLIADYHKYCEITENPVSLGKYMFGNF